MQRHAILPLVFSVACAGGSGADSGASLDACLPGGSPSLSLGQGELGFEPLGDGASAAELIHGPQGGYHINIGLEASQLDASVPWEAHLQGWIDGELVGETYPWATMRCNRAVDALQAWGMLLVWDAEPEELHGKVTLVEASIVDASGTEISATAEFTIFDPLLD
jgi:hypothetical protein